MPQSGPTLLAMTLAAVIAVLPFFAIAVVNLVIIRHGWTPLTQLVENYLRRYPLIAAGLCGFFGALAGHVFWSFGDNPPAKPAPFYLLVVALGLAIVAGVLGAALLAAVATILSRIGSALRGE